MSTSVSTTQLNLRIISIVVFTCICYLSIGLPLAVLPGYIHYQLGYSTFVAGIVISLQYISTLISRPHAGRYTDIWGPKKVVSLGIVCCLLSGAFTLLAVVLQATPMLAIAALLAGRVFLGVGESFIDGFDVLNGPDSLIHQGFVDGCSACISGLANVAPAEINAIWSRFHAGDIAGSRQAQEQVTGLRTDLYKVAFSPAAVKKALQLMGHEVGDSRYAVQFSDHQLQQIKNIINTYLH